MRHLRSKFSARTTALGLVVAAVIAGACAERLTTPSGLRSTDIRPVFNVRNTVTGEVWLCPEGPAGTYTYSLSVAIDPNWTNGSTSGTWSDADIALASDAEHQTALVSPQSFTIPESNSGATCVLVFKILKTIGFVNPYNGALQDPIREVSITQVSGPGGTQLDSVVTTEGATGFDEPDVVWYAPTVTVAVDANGFHGVVASFWNSLVPPPPPPPNTPCPAGSFTYSIAANGDLNIVFDQFPAPNDNSYGLGSVGWGGKVHRLSDLYNSDHAGFQLIDPSGAIRLQFLVDYLTAKPGTPSGYASLGVTGGDGKMIIGTASGITASTSMERNLNDLGYFSGGVQVVGNSVANLLVDSPPTVSNTSYELTPAAAAVFGDWDFRNTYYVTISAAKLASLGFDASTWSVEPDPTGLHNSPAKPCPTGTSGPCNLAVTKYEVKDKQVKVTILNKGGVDEFISAVNITWPTTNGKLMQVKLDGDVIYESPDIAGGSANLTLAQLVADKNKRKIGKGTSDVLMFTFEKKADAILARYTGDVKFGDDCDKTILPPQ